MPKELESRQKKRERAQAFAARQDRSPLDNVLFPRTKGFVATVQGLRTHIDAVYDLTIGYPNGPISLWPYIQGVEKDFYLHVQRTPLAELPQDGSALHEWLVTRFYEKDRRLASFHKIGRFEPSEGVLANYAEIGAPLLSVERTAPTEVVNA